MVERKIVTCTESDCLIEMLNRLCHAEPDAVHKSIPAADRGSLFYSVVTFVLKISPLVPWI